MVQKEVGDRFNAKVGTKDYNSLTVFLNYYFDIKKLMNVSRNSFVPAPNVDSVIIEMDKKKNNTTITGKKLNTLPTPANTPSMIRLCTTGLIP